MSPDLIEVRACLEEARNAETVYELGHYLNQAISALDTEPPAYHPERDAFRLRATQAEPSAIAARHARRRPHGECAYCDQYGDDPMMPSHTASERCESGKHPHCTCDACF